MSSPHNNTNSDSVSFQIPDSHINAFLYQTKNGHHCKSQLLPINNIPFQIGLFSNGKTKKNIGNIQFIVSPDKNKDSLVNYVAVYCQIYCPTLGIMFKGSKALHKTNDILQLQLSKDEHEDIIIKNGIMFICHIEVLKITYKSTSSIGNLSRKLSLSKTKRRRSSGNNSIDLSSMTIFEPQTFHAKSQVNIEMVINQKIPHPIYSEDINNMWCLCIIPPNKLSSKKHVHKNVQLVVKMIRLPHYDIRSIEVNYTIEIIPLITQESSLSNPVYVYGRNVLFSYHKSTETSNLFDVSRLDEFGGWFKLKMNMKIMRVFEDIGKKEKGKEIDNDSWVDFDIERVEFKPETIQCAIDDQQLERNKLNPYERDDMKYPHSPNSVDEITENMSALTSTSKSKKSTYKERKEPRSVAKRKASYSTASGTTVPYERDSITALVGNELQCISENKEDNLNIPVILWDQNDEIIENKQSQHEAKSDENIFTKKFALWLCDDVKLGQYLSNFVAKEWNDIRMIDDFNDGTLVSVGIKNEYYRRLILKEVRKFQRGYDNFQQLIGKHQALLKPLEKCFQESGIWTLDELQRIKSKSALFVIIKSSDMLNEVWNIIQLLPLQSHINQIQQKQSKFVKDVINHCTDLMEAYKESEDNQQIQQQVASMLGEVFRVLKDQKAKYDFIRNRTSLSDYTSTRDSSDEFNYSHANSSNINNIISKRNPPVKQTVNRFQK